jgi:hypothetical protein
VWGAAPESPGDPSGGSGGPYAGPGCRGRTPERSVPRAGSGVSRVGAPSPGSLTRCAQLPSSPIFPGTPIHGDRAAILVFVILQVKGGRQKSRRGHSDDPLKSIIFSRFYDLAIY